MIIKRRGFCYAIKIILPVSRTSPGRNPKWQVAKVILHVNLRPYFRDPYVKREKYLINVTKAALNAVRSECVELREIFFFVNYLLFTYCFIHSEGE